MTNWIRQLIGETQLRLLTLLRRSPLTITQMAERLQVTDNAVRSHMATLGRDGIVEPAGNLREGRGKPARLYALTRQGEELFPKAYAVVLDSLIEELGRREGEDQAIALLRAAGNRLGAAVARPADFEGRVNAAAQAVEGLGGDIEVQASAGGWRLQGHGCPLSMVTARRHEVCSLVQAIIEEVLGHQVTECCDRGDRPRCAFDISRP